MTDFLVHAPIQHCKPFPYGNGMTSSARAVLLLPQDRLVPNESEKAGSIRSHLPMPNAWLSATSVLAMQKFRASNRQI